MPEFYRNAWFAQLKKKVDELEEEIQKAIELPTVTSADDGKVLTVDSSGEWIAGISYPVNYSTDERLIGTWVNGQPLYQKTIGYTSNGGDSDTDNVIDTSIRQGDNAFVVDMCGVEGYGYLINDELRMNGTTAPEPIGQYYIHLPFFGGGTAKSPYIYCGGDGVHFLKNGDAQAAKSIVITLRYIKLQDA